MKSKNILIRLIDFKISILTKLKNILMSCVFIFGSLSLSGCYTQLAMFYPEPEIEQDEELFYETYSRAAPRVNVGIYAQDGAGQSLGMAYQLMYNRFRGFSGFGNRYNYYNPYGYGGYYNNSYTLGGYTMYIPYSDIYASGEKKQRTWTTDRGSSTSGTNLNVTRTRTESSTNSNTNSGGYNNSSNVSSTKSSSGGSSSSSSSSSSGGRRATRRN